VYADSKLGGGNVVERIRRQSDVTQLHNAGNHSVFGGEDVDDDDDESAYEFPYWWFFFIVRPHCAACFRPAGPALTCLLLLFRA
jgi:hypothetical protein